MLPQLPENNTPASDTGGLVGWIMARIVPWRQHRDTNHKDKWNEYYRIWRMKYDPTDRQRKSERSQLMSPATMQAVETTVAEIEEAMFGREQWFELGEDLEEAQDPKERDEAIRSRDRLRERMERDKVPSAVAKAILLGTVYGTGIGKVNTFEKKAKKIVKGDAGPEVREVVQVHVEVIPLEPYEFIPDPSTDDIEEMLGCGHETELPLHTIKQKQRDGKYFKTPVGAYTSDPNLRSVEANFALPVQDGVRILEWHGLVPASLLLRYAKDMTEEEHAKLTEGLDPDEDEMVEAIVTIANDSIVIEAKRSPFWMEDRSIIAYQHDTIPGYFWGRGVPEKAYHSQKGLDGTVRARQDALGLVAHPMMAGDVTRLPRGLNLGVWPGKFWPTSGSPSEVLQPFTYGNLNPALFEVANDFERNVGTATGAMDPASAYSPTTSGATNTALNGAAFLKRARRAMQNIERGFMRPLVQKIYWRYVQFEPTEFPQDYEVSIKGTLGIMAREFEQQQMTQVLGLVPQESKPFYAILKAIFDNSSSPHKGAILQAVDEFINPPENPEAAAAAAEQKAMEKRGIEATVAELEAKAQKAMADAEFAKARAKKTDIEAEFIDDELQNDAMDKAINLREVAAFEEQNKISWAATKMRAMDTAIKAIQAQIDLQQVQQEANRLQNS